MLDWFANVRKNTFGRRNRQKIDSDSIKPLFLIDGRGKTSQDFTRIIRAINAAREIIIFTGAGISAESGIPTFCDGATGLWNNVDPDQVASIRGFQANPERVWAWHTQLNICPRIPLPRQHGSRSEH